MVTTTLPLIRLVSPSERSALQSFDVPQKRSVFSRVIETVKRGRRRAKEKRKTLPKPLRILTSEVTTGVLAGTAAALAFPATAVGLASRSVSFLAKRPLFTAFGLPTLIGVGLTAPSLVRQLSPAASLRRGRAVGEFVETGELPFGLDVPGLISKFGPAGLIGAGALAAGAAGVAGLRGLRGRAGRAAPTVTSQVGIVPPISTGVVEPLGPAVQPKPAIEEVKEVGKPVAVKPTSIKITNKPKIDISFRKSKRFINQQVNL